MSTIYFDLVNLNPMRILIVEFSSSNCVNFISSLTGFYFLGGKAVAHTLCNVVVESVAVKPSSAKIFFSTFYFPSVLIIIV